jgi:hypothetical protein
MLKASDEFAKDRCRRAAFDPEEGPETLGPHRMPVGPRFVAVCM